MNFHRSQVSIGIECCDQQIRAVRITKTKKSTQINAIAIVDINHDCQKNQLKALTKLRKLLHYKNELTIYTVNHNEVITKILSVDATLNDKEIIKYLTTQSLHIFGHSYNDLFFDYNRIESTKKFQKIHAVAAKKTHIHQIKKLFSLCKFRLKTIDVNILSIGRTLPYLSDYSDDGNYFGVMIFHCTQLSFGVFNKQKNVYSITIEYVDAAQRKLAILSSINRALQFFKNTNAHLEIDLIVLMGKSNDVSIAQCHMNSKYTIKTSFATLDPNKIYYSSFNKYLFTSLGAALWNKTS